MTFREWRLVAAIAALVSGPCRADDLSKWWLQLGTTDDHHGPVVPVAAVSRFWSGIDLGSFDIAPEAIAGVIGSRGGGRHASSAVPFVGAGVRVAYRNWPVVLNFTPVFNSKTNQNIGGHLNFLTELSYRTHGATLSLAHISNADRVHPNRGENMVLLGLEL